MVGRLSAGHVYQGILAFCSKAKRYGALSEDRLFWDSKKTLKRKKDPSKSKKALSVFDQSRSYGATPG